MQFLVAEGIEKYVIYVVAGISPRENCGSLIDFNLKENIILHSISIFCDSGQKCFNPFSSLLSFKVCSEQNTASTKTLKQG